jgi:hypothetical protein
MKESDALQAKDSGVDVWEASKRHSTRLIINNMIINY